MQGRCSSMERHQNIARVLTRLPKSASPSRRICREKRFNGDLQKSELRFVASFRTRTRTYRWLDRSLAKKEEITFCTSECRRRPERPTLAVARAIDLDRDSIAVDNNNNSRCVRFHERATRVLLCRELEEIARKRRFRLSRRFLNRDSIAKRSIKTKTIPLLSSDNLPGDQTENRVTGAPAPFTRFCLIERED